MCNNEGRSLGEKPQDKYVKVEVISALGGLRAAEASEYLASEVAYFFAVGGSPHPLSLYPAAKALADIGDPGIRKIIDHLGRPASAISDKQLKLFAFVIHLVDEKQLGLARLEIALTQEKQNTRGSPERRENLARLIRIYKATDFEDMKQWPRPERRGRND